MKLAIGDIRTDGGTQVRAELSEDTVCRYAESYREGDIFPPVPVFYDGTYYWLGDGFHRVAAAKREKWTTIEADVRPGSRDDAVIFSWSANESIDHRKAAMPRTNADKRRAVESALRFYEGKAERKSDRQIAELCRVSKTLVVTVRNSSGLTTSSPSNPAKPQGVRGKDGKLRKTKAALVVDADDDDRLPPCTEFDGSSEVATLRETIDALIAQWPSDETMGPLVLMFLDYYEQLKERP